MQARCRLSSRASPTPLRLRRRLRVTRSSECGWSPNPRTLRKPCPSWLSQRTASFTTLTLRPCRQCRGVGIDGAESAAIHGSLAGRGRRILHGQGDDRGQPGRAGSQPASTPLSLLPSTGCWRRSTAPASSLVRASPVEPMGTPSRHARRSGRGLTKKPIRQRRRRLPEQVPALRLEAPEVTDPRIDDLRLPAPVCRFFAGSPRRLGDRTASCDVRWRRLGTGDPAAPVAARRCSVDGQASCTTRGL